MQQVPLFLLGNRGFLLDNYRKEKPFFAETALISGKKPAILFEYSRGQVLL